MNWLAMIAVVLALQLVCDVAVAAVVITKKGGKKVSARKLEVEN